MCEGKLLQKLRSVIWIMNSCDAAQGPSCLLGNVSTGFWNLALHSYNTVWLRMDRLETKNQRYHLLYSIILPFQNGEVTLPTMQQSHWMTSLTINTFVTRKKPKHTTFTASSERRSCYLSRKLYMHKGHDLSSKWESCYVGWSLNKWVLSILRMMLVILSDQMQLPLNSTGFQY